VDSGKQIIISTLPVLSSPEALIATTDSAKLAPIWRYNETAWENS